MNWVDLVRGVIEFALLILFLASRGHNYNLRKVVDILAIAIEIHGGKAAKMQAEKDTTDYGLENTLDDRLNRLGLLNSKKEYNA